MRLTEIAINNRVTVFFLVVAAILCRFSCLSDGASRGLFPTLRFHL